MNWLEKIENTEFTITTGDSEVWYPLWTEQSKETEYNNEIFDFIDVEASYVRRKKRRSSNYSLSFFFQGEFCNDYADRFEYSAKDKRAWKIIHPFYGEITGQPISLKRNDSVLNISGIEVDFWESLDLSNFKTLSSKKVDLIPEKYINYVDSSAQVYKSKVNLKPIDQKNILENVSKFSAKYKDFLDDTNYNDFVAVLSATLASIDDVILYPTQFIKDVNTLIQFPSNLAKSIEFRVFLIQQVYQDILQTIESAEGVIKGPNDKAYFEALGGACVVSIGQILLNPSTYNDLTRQEIMTSYNMMSKFYSDYLKKLDEIQVGIYNVKNSFNSGFQNQKILNDIVVLILSSLYELSFGAKQKREVVLEKDTNLIVLCHKYVGLDAEDMNLENFRKLNGIKNKGLFTIKKGRTIKYFQ